MPHWEKKLDGTAIYVKPDQELRDAEGNPLNLLKFAGKRVVDKAVAPLKQRLVAPVERALDNLDARLAHALEQMPSVFSGQFSDERLRTYQQMTPADRAKARVQMIAELRAQLSEAYSGTHETPADAFDAAANNGFYEWHQRYGDPTVLGRITLIDE